MDGQTKQCLKCGKEQSVAALTCDCGSDLSQQGPQVFEDKAVDAESARHPVVLPITINLLSIVTWIIMAGKTDLTLPPFDPVQLGLDPTVVSPAAS